MEKLENLIKGMIMNRASLLGVSCVIGGLAGWVTGLIKGNGYLMLYSTLTGCVGASMLYATSTGPTTYDTYEETKSHIQEHGRLDHHFIKTCCKYYCGRQGVYLAAKELGCLDDYKKGKRGNWTRILNF